MSKVHSDLEALREEYLSQIRGLFPLHRATLLLIALVIVVAVQNNTFKSVSEGLLNLKLRAFADLEKGFFAAVTVQEALIAIGLLVLGAMMHRLIQMVIFLWLRRNLNLDEVARKMNAKSASSMDGTIAGYFALKRSEKEASNWSKKISGLSLISESAIVLFLVFIYAGYFGNIIDYGVGLVFFVGALIAQARSYVVFLRHYLPHTMHIRGVLGQGSEVELPR